MADDLEASDNYLNHVRSAILEASQEVMVAGSVSIEHEGQRQALGQSLGRALNALSRAQRDLEAHAARTHLREDRSQSESYFEQLQLGLSQDDLPQIAVAIVPMPIEEERLDLRLLLSREFGSNFTTLVTRYNNETRQRMGYLMEVPGGLTPTFERDHFAFLAMAQGSNEVSQRAELYLSGAFVFKRRLYSWQEPPRYAIGYLVQEVRATLGFLWRLYEELHILPRALALQVVLAHAEKHSLMVPGMFEGQFNQLNLSEHSARLVLPEKPLVAPFSTLEALETRALPTIETLARSAYQSA